MLETACFWKWDYRPPMLERNSQKEKKKQGSWGSYLNQVIEELFAQDIWNLSIGKSAFNKLINMTIKSLSHSMDENTLLQRKHAWMVISSYEKNKPQEYRSAFFSLTLKHQFMRLRLGMWETKDLIPAWKDKRENRDCRLCGYKEESIQHIFCVCPKLLEERTSLLKSLLNSLNIRTCREAVITWLSGASIPLVCRGGWNV